MSIEAMDTTGTDVIMPLEEEEFDALVGAAATGGASSGRYWFTTWKQAASYKEPKVGAKPAGHLKAGRNYFYGQRRFNVEAVDGPYRSHWWALTDDDSHNKQVWISCIYFKGGANDQPVKGLPKV